MKTIVRLAPALAALIVQACSGGEDTPSVDAGVEVTLERIEVRAPSLMLREGGEVRFVAIGTYSDETEENLSAVATWSSSDPAVATIAQTGLARARAPGATEIRAEVEGVASPSATLTVLRAPVRSIEVTPTSVSLFTGEQAELTAVATLTNGSTVGVTASASWTSSDPAVAEVSGGVVTARSEGTATISARDDNAGISSGARSATVEVKDPRPTALSVDPRSAILVVGAIQAVTARLSFDDGSTRDVTQAVQWTSVDEDIVEVSNEVATAGQVTAFRAGTTRVAAEHLDSGLTDEMRITVEPPVLTSLRVTPAFVTLQLRERQALEAIAVYSDGTEVVVSRGVEFASSDPSVVALETDPTQPGVVRALSVGAVTISVSDPESGISSDDSGGSATVTVPEPTVQSVIVIPLDTNLAAGLSQPFQAFAVYSDNSGVEITDSAVWSSTSTAVATVDSTGLVQAVAEGTTTIDAVEPTTGISSAASGQSANLTVDPPILLSVGVTPAAVAMVVGSVQQFTAIGRYSDGVARDLSATVTWETSDPALSISPTGLATAQAVGDVAIRASEPSSGISSDDSNESARALISDAQLVSIAVSPPTGAVPPGADLPLTANGTYDNGSVVDITELVAWTSSNPAVAEVETAAGARGVVRGLAPGSVTVSALEPASGVSSDQSGSSGAITVLSGVTLGSILVTPPTATFNVNRGFGFDASGSFSDGMVYPMTQSVAWSSSDASVATVSNAPGSRGVATGVGVGTAVISAAFSGVSSDDASQSALATVERGIEIGDVVHYELDDGAGTTVASASPNGPPGTIVGPHTWNGPGTAPGTSAFYLTMPSGSTNHVAPNLGASVTFTDLTIDFWWRFGSGTGLSYMWNSGSSFRAFTGGVAGNGIWVRQTPGGSDVTYSSNVQDGMWHHFAYVLDSAGRQGRLYFDGVEVGTTAYSGSITISSWVLLGQSSSNGASVDYDRYRVWSTAQTPQQIADMVAGSR